MVHTLRPLRESPEVDKKTITMLESLVEEREKEQELLQTIEETRAAVRTGYLVFLDIAEDEGIDEEYLKLAFEDVLIGNLLVKEERFIALPKMVVDYHPYTVLRTGEAHSRRRKEADRSLREMVNHVDKEFMFITPAILGVALGALSGGPLGLAVGYFGTYLLLTAERALTGCSKRRKAKKECKVHEEFGRIEYLLKELEASGMVRHYFGKYSECPVDLDTVVEAYAKHAVDIDYEAVLERAAELKAEDLRKERAAAETDAYLETEVAAMLETEGYIPLMLETRYRMEYDEEPLRGTLLPRKELKKRIEHCVEVMKEKDREYAREVLVSKVMKELKE